MVYDIMRPDTLETINKWVDYFIKANHKIVPTILDANIIDLGKSGDSSINVETTKMHLDKLSKKYNQQFRYIETPPLTSENIDKVFKKLIDELLDLYIND